MQMSTMMNSRIASQRVVVGRSLGGLSQVASRVRPFRAEASQQEGKMFGKERAAGLESSETQANGNVQKGSQAAKAQVQPPCHIRSAELEAQISAGKLNLTALTSTLAFKSRHLQGPCQPHAICPCSPLLTSRARS